MSFQKDRKMDANRVRDIVAQQRATEARKPPKLCGEPRLGDVVAVVLSVVVLTYALIESVIRLLP
jgi:hypothetical protein